MQSLEIDLLSHEQRRIQTTKHTTRLLSGDDGYNDHFFPRTYDRNEVRQTKVVEFLQARYPGVETLEQIMYSMHSRRSGKPHWVDMGCGFGGAMRELQFRRGAEFVTQTCVDIVDHHTRDVPLRAAEKHQTILPGFDITDDQYAPPFVCADITNVQLDEAASLITSVQALMYLRDPLAAIANWYNQLEPGGLGLIATRMPWASLIRQYDSPGVETLDNIMANLEEAGIPHAFNSHLDISDIEFANTFAIERVPGTYLAAAPLIETSAGSDGFRVATYAAGTLALQAFDA